MKAALSAAIFVRSLARAATAADTVEHPKRHNPNGTYSVEPANNVRKIVFLFHRKMNLISTCLRFASVSVPVGCCLRRA